MKYLLELLEVSSFKPNEGYGFELLELFSNGAERGDALKHWEKLGRSSDSLRQTIKKLKDNLLREAFLDRDGLSDVQKRRVECWDKFSKVKSLLIVGKRTAAMSTAFDTVKLAQKCGFTEVELSLSLLLENHYAVFLHDTQKYLRFRKIRKTASNNYECENQAFTLYTQLIFFYLKKKDIDGLSDRIDALKKCKCATNNFIQWKCSILSTWYQLKDNYDGLRDILKETLNFFEQNKKYTAYSAFVQVNQRLAAVLVAQKKYDEADLYLSKALTYPKPGTFSFHQILLNKAMLGFHSDKPKIALNAWKRALDLNENKDERTSELWLIIRAWLEIYKKIGSLKIEDNFKMGKFLNSLSKCEQEKNGSNVSIIIVTMMNYLLDGNLKSFMNKADGISSYSNKYLRGRENIRKRSILYMLKKVEEADYYKLRTELRVGRWKKQLKGNPLKIVDFSEIMPYEKVWEIVLSQLK